MTRKRGSGLFFTLSRNKQYLYCIGAEHVFDPNHPQFQLIDRLWNKFMQNTANKKKIVFIEGGLRSVSKDKIATIKTDGEAGYASWLAIQNNIKIKSPEPPEKYERKELLKKFSMHEIELYYFARYVYQWNNMEDRPIFKKYIDDFLATEEKYSGWNDFDFSLSKIKSFYKKTLSKNFKPTDKKFLYSIINPTYKTKKTIVNEISKESGKIRDRYILKSIVKEWDKEFNIFVVYGSSHALFLKKNLKDRK